MNGVAVGKMKKGKGVNSKNKIQHFTDLDVWQNAHELVLEVYKITKTFPEEERFGLSSQMRRAAVSVTSNISEGFGRRNKKEKAHFYSMAQSSLGELQNQMLIARDVDYISGRQTQEWLDKSSVVHKQLTVLIRSVLL